MATSNGLCLGFLLLVLCLSHGSWSGSARSIDSNEFMLAQSKRQLSEESNPASELAPGGPSDHESVQESSTQPLEVVQGSAPAPSQLGDVDQVAWCWPSCGHRAASAPAPTNYPPNNCASCGCNPSSPYPPGQACQPATTQPGWGCQNTYPSQPGIGCQQGYPAPQRVPSCQQGYPSTGCQQGYPGTGCQQGYPPQPNPECQQGYPPQPDCQRGYPSQTCPECQQGYPPQPGCANTGCQQGYYPPQTNPGCANAECQPAHAATEPACINAGCETVAYPPQVNNPPWPEATNPELPEPFYPPQSSPSDSSPGNGPRVTVQNSLEQENNDGSLRSNEGEMAPADKVKEGEPINDQEWSSVTTAGTA